MSIADHGTQHTDKARLQATWCVWCTLKCSKSKEWTLRREHYNMIRKLSCHAMTKHSCYKGHMKWQGANDACIWNSRTRHTWLVDVQSLYKRIAPLNSFPISRLDITWLKENILLKVFFCCSFKVLICSLFIGSRSDCTWHVNIWLTCNADTYVSRHASIYKAGINTCHENNTISDATFGM